MSKTSQSFHEVVTESTNQTLKGIESLFVDIKPAERNLDSQFGINDKNLIGIREEIQSMNTELSRLLLHVNENLTEIQQNIEKPLASVKNDLAHTIEPIQKLVDTQHSIEKEEQIIFQDNIKRDISQDIVQNTIFVPGDEVDDVLAVQQSTQYAPLVMLLASGALLLYSMVGQF